MYSKIVYRNNIKFTWNKKSSDKNYFCWKWLNEGPCKEIGIRKSEFVAKTKILSSGAWIHGLRRLEVKSYICAVHNVK